MNRMKVPPNDRCASSWSSSIFSARSRPRPSVRSPRASLEGARRATTRRSLSRTRARRGAARSLPGALRALTTHRARSQEGQVVRPPAHSSAPTAAGSVTAPSLCRNYLRLRSEVTAEERKLPLDRFEILDRESLPDAPDTSTRCTRTWCDRDLRNDRPIPCLRARPSISPHVRHDEAAIVPMIRREVWVRV